MTENKDEDKSKNKLPSDFKSKFNKPKLIFIGFTELLRF